MFRHLAGLLAGVALAPGRWIAAAGSACRPHRPSPLSTANPPSLENSTAVSGETTASVGWVITGMSIW